MNFSGLNDMQTAYQWTGHWNYSKNDIAVYPPARRKLAEHGICCAGKTARQMTRRDYETYDYLIAMDRNNLLNMVRFVGSDPEHKVSLLMDHTSRPGDVADPWYTGDFEATWQDVLEGCTALLEELR